MSTGPFLSTYSDIALFILRLTLGAICFVHGWPKIRDIAATKEAFTKMFVPLPLVSTLYAAFVEFFGGIFLILGLYTGWVALGIIIDMFGAMLFVDFKKAFLGGWELNLALLGLATTLFLAGPGAYILSNYLVR